MIKNILNIKTASIFLGITALIFVGVYSLKANDKVVTNPNISKVESKYVCMINNKLFKDEQIPVEIDGKTYYGCCDMCKGKLENHPQSRASIDPVSGVQVDKATAVIGATNTGKIYYFENIPNLNKFEN